MIRAFPGTFPGMVAFVIILIVVGLFVGLIARLLVPGRDNVGLLGTILVGIVGSGARPVPPPGV